MLRCVRTEYPLAGALSADVILGEDAPVFIDVNPAWSSLERFLCGVDLVGSMTELAIGRHPAAQPEGKTGMATHRCCSPCSAPRSTAMAAVASGLSCSMRCRKAVTTSAPRRLTPLGHDLRSIVPVAMAGVATMVAPKTWSWFTAGSVSSCAQPGGLAGHPPRG